MKITVVTISFNQEHFIRRCIESVLSQDYEDFEYIICDAGSTDGSRDIISSYKDSRIRCIFELDFGPADGLNKGFSSAIGDIFYYINSDDYVLPSAFRRAIDKFETERCDVVLGGGFIVNGVGEFVKRIVPSRFDQQLYVNGQVTFLQQGFYCTSKIFRDVGGFNKNNKSNWDGELMFRIAAKNPKISYDSSLYACFRIYPTSITGSGSHAERLEKIRDELFFEVFKYKRSEQSFISKLFYRFLKFFLSPTYTLVSVKSWVLRVF